MPVRSSVKLDAVTCLECGKAFKSLKRHIRGEHNLDPSAYRAKWNLKPNYPMVAPNYSEARSSLAKGMGLGRRQSEGGPNEVPNTAVGGTAEGAT